MTNAQKITRRVIIHYHIFKNAGVTVDTILRKNFNPNCGEIEGDTRTSTLKAGDLLNYALQNQNLKVISSHQARLPAPTYPNIAFYPIIFLRHPIDRVGSVYSFARRQPVDDPGIISKLARENILASFIKLAQSKRVDVVISNFQITHISGRALKEQKPVAVYADLKLAKQRLNELAFFGIVERFDESLLLIQHFLFEAFGLLDLSYSVENKSVERKNSLEDRLADLKAEIGASLYQELLERNALDLELYEYAVQLFKKRFAALKAERI